MGGLFRIFVDITHLEECVGRNGHRKHSTYGTKHFTFARGGGFLLLELLA